MAGILLGFALKETSAFVERKREDRRVLAKALHELLEVRSSLLLQPTIIKELKRIIPAQMAPHEELMLRRAIPEFFSSCLNAQELSRRYNAAVSDVSAVFPILAYKLRSRDLAGPVLARMNAVPVPPEGAAFFIAIEDEAVGLMLPVLEELIEEVSKRHSRESAKAVKDIISNPVEFPGKFHNFLSGQIMTLIEAEKARAKQNPSKQSAPGQTEMA